MIVHCPVDGVLWESMHAGTTCWFCDGMLGVTSTPSQIGVWPFADNAFLTYRPPVASVANVWAAAAERARMATAAAASALVR